MYGFYSIEQFGKIFSLLPSSSDPSDHRGPSPLLSRKALSYRRQSDLKVQSLLASWLVSRPVF